MKSRTFGNCRIVLSNQTNEKECIAKWAFAAKSAFYVEIWKVLVRNLSVGPSNNQQVILIPQMMRT